MKYGDPQRFFGAPTREPLTGLNAQFVKLPRERESRGRQRWLSADELAAFARECPGEWWPFFAVLFHTGACTGEVRGLRGGHILVHAKRITIHEGDRHSRR